MARVSGRTGARSDSCPCPPVKEEDEETLEVIKVIPSQRSSDRIEESVNVPVPDVVLHGAAKILEVIKDTSRDFGCAARRERNS